MDSVEKLLSTGHFRASAPKGTCQFGETAKLLDGYERQCIPGLSRLEWKRLRRITGLSPWGEQLLFRLKHNANSLHDPTSGTMGCPHSGCEHVGHLDLHHVFWSCPAAEILRRVFIQRWRAAGLQTTALEEACFSLELPHVPAGIWQTAEQMFPNLLSAASVMLTEEVTRLAESCWRIGVALDMHVVWRWRVAF